MLQQYKKIIGLSMILSSPASLAADYEINTFLSIGGVVSDSESGAYLQQISDHISLEYDSKYGINLRTQLNEDIEGAAQLLANGRDGKFDTEVEWAYVSYALSDSLRLRIGKLNLQTFLLSDYVEVGFLYPWVRPPEEVYGLNPMRNFPGVEIMHTARFGNTSLTSQFFIGSAQVDISATTRFKALNGFGINFQLDAPNYSLRLGSITPVVELQQAPAGNFTGGYLDEEDRMYMVTVGYSFDLSNIIGYGEYISVTADGETGRVFPDQTGYYMTFGYQYQSWLPYVTFASNGGESNYAFLDSVTTAAETFQPNPLILQDSISFGLRYDINDYAAIKFEVKNVDPTLDPALGAGAFNAGWSIDTTGAGGVTDDKYNVASITYDMIF